MKRKNILVILVSVLLIGTVAAVTGVSVAYWVGSSESNEIAPQTDTTDWNYWSKYFIYEEIKDVATGQVVGYKTVGFEGAVYENMVIPRSPNGGRLKGSDTVITNSTLTVMVVGNSTFANTTDKSIPVTLTIPTTVDVEPGAFIGLGNLVQIKIVLVANNKNEPDTDIDIGESAFFGCNNVVKFIIDGSILVSRGLIEEFTFENINFTYSNASVTGAGITLFSTLVEVTGLPTNLTPTLQ